MRLRLVNYKESFLFQEEVSFLDASIKDVVEDMMSFGFLLTPM